MSDPRLGWWTHLAGEHGDCAIMFARCSSDINDNGSIEAAAEEAREAGHYGNLVLDSAHLDGKHIVVMDVRVASQSLESFYQP